MVEHVKRELITPENMTKKLNYTTDFENQVSGPHGVIDGDSPEILFMDYICKGEADKAAALFDDTKLFGDKSVIDEPHGRYEGLDEIRHFTNGWLDFSLAESGWITPLVQTRCMGRSLTEMMINLKIRGTGGRVLKFPAAVIGDIRPGNRLDELRVYYFCEWMPGIIPYRPRQWKPQHGGVADHEMLYGSLKLYFDTMHMKNRPLDKMLMLFDSDIRSGEYRPDQLCIPFKGYDGAKELYSRLYGPTPLWNVLRIEHVIDDGIIGAVEWISCPTPPEECSEEKYRPCQWDVHSWQSGFAAYERNPKNGKIWCIRICDYYGYEYPDNRIKEAYMGNPYPSGPCEFNEELKTENLHIRW
jgi:hypothetical protein